MGKTLFNSVDDKYQEARDLRKELHENPELSSKEFETSHRLKVRAAALGLEIHDVPVDDRSAGTGFIAILDTGKPGKTLGLRTDIDALPIQEHENNLAGPRSVRSKVPGIMHSCGHDGHMATLVTAMDILTGMKDQLTGKIIFIFEEAEEVGNGIRAMTRLLSNYTIDAIYGNHFASVLDLGVIAADPGPVLSGMAWVNFDIIGRGGHGSRPDLSINPLYAGVAVLNSLSIAWNNQINVEKTVTLGITQFNAGSQPNVFADRAHIAGTLRYFDVEEGEKAYQMVEEIAKTVAKVHQCEVEMVDPHGAQTIPVVNDPDLAQLSQTIVEDLYPGHLLQGFRWFASETFAQYRQLAPIMFTFIGIRDKVFGSGAEHHNEYFDMPDEAMKYAITTMVAFAFKFLTPDK